MKFSDAPETRKRGSGGVDGKKAAERLLELAKGVEAVLIEYIAECEEEEAAAACAVEEAAGEFFNVKEAAEYMRLSTSTVTKAVMNRSISFCKKGRRVIFSRGQLDRFLLGKARMSDEELERKADALLLNRRRRGRMRNV